MSKDESDESLKRVGIAGLGTVGCEVARRLHGRRDKHRKRTDRNVRLEAVADPFEQSELENQLTGVDVYRDANKLIKHTNIDVLVSLIGGVHPAKDLILTALKHDLDVVTANKELLAKHGHQIFITAREQHQDLRFEASIGGSIPIVRTIREAFIDVDFEAIYGIINGTANYILTRMIRDDQSFDQALKTAQKKGFAESDPSYDVEGDDSAHKISLLGSVALGDEIPFEKVYCEGITKIKPAILEDARELGYSIKLLGIAKHENGELDLRVHPTLIPAESALAAVNNQYNAIFVQGDPVGSCMLSGKGAGGSSTATAVVGDVYSIASKQERTESEFHFSDESIDLIPIEKIRTRYYLRVQAEDRPGVLSKVTEILSKNDISINSILQREQSEEEKVPVTLTTHISREGDMRQAIQKIKSLDVIGEDPLWLRIEDDL